MADQAPWSRLRSRVFSLLSHNPKSNRAIVDLASFQPTDSVLDIGCGPGAAVRAAAPRVARAVGVDRAEEMVTIARRRSQNEPNVEFAVGAAESLPFDDAQFDWAWTIRAFHHWDVPSLGLAEARRVLKPNGRFLIIERETRGKHGLTRKAAARLQADLASVGFSSSSVTRHGKELVVTGRA